ncbi:hypothetical protein ABIB89_003253 [Bradyrhizobium sp. JR3.12]
MSHNVLPARVRDLTGARFGMLIATSYAGILKGRAAYWNVHCDCGKTNVVRSSALVAGKAVSCGCYKLVATRTHGHYVGGQPSGEYNSWANMIQRCTNPEHPHYEDYGGRGIRVCERWLVFENFLADMGKKPLSSYSIERVENRLGYFLKNCVWASALTQARNKRRYRK